MKPKRRRRSPKATAAALEAVRRLLVAMYGRRAQSMRRPLGLNVLVEAMLAQNTNMANASRGYRALRRRFNTWTKVMLAQVEDVQREIAICGLSRTRARRLQAILAKIKSERGKLAIDFLADLPLEDAYAWLTRFDGIGPKTAAFVCLFALDLPVLPIDNGVLRVLRRLKLVRTNARDTEAERSLSPVVPRGRHYELHVLLFAHAKTRCRPKNPKCDECKLIDRCPFGQRCLEHLPPREAEPLALMRRERQKIIARYASAGIAKRATPTIDDRP